MNIEQVIEEAELSSIVDPRTGDCVSVAVAMNEFFEADRYICCYEIAGDTRPVHAAVEIDGEVYDGTGKTSLERLYDTATSGLRKREIGERSEHIGYPTRLRRNALYDEEVKEQVVNRLCEVQG